MSALPAYEITEAEYLAFERASEIKHEFVDGHIRAMTDFNMAHCLINGSVLACIHGQLREHPAKVYASRMRTRTPITGTFLYPDVTIAHDDAQYDAHMDGARDRAAYHLENASQCR